MDLSPLACLFSKLLNSQRVEEILKNISQAAIKYQLDVPVTPTPQWVKWGMACFMAQCSHESDGFKTTHEYASGTEYEGRLDLGNYLPGDGERFKGRGYIQLTGHENYFKYSIASGVDYVQSPALLERDLDAATVSAWFWNKNSLGNFTDQMVETTTPKRDKMYRIVTKIINGGYNGYDRRLLLLQQALKGLGLEW
jgi:putative chitinase